MAVPKWFDYATYMTNKLAQMQEENPSYTMTMLTNAFNKAGYSGDEGALKHFQKWGASEDVAPNSHFDAQYYYKAKALQYYTSTEGGSIDKATVLNDLDAYALRVKGLINAAGMNAWTHYIKWGTAEGINPSNEFDTSTYLTAKLTAMQTTNPGYTMADLTAALKHANWNALEHFMMYGGKGGAETSVGPNADGSIPSDYEVPADERFEDKTDGKSFTLTTGTDTIQGTSGNDQINGVTGYGIVGKDTYNVSDTITDNNTSDSDVLDLHIGGEQGAYVPVKNIEQINLTDALGADYNFDATGVTGAKQIKVISDQNVAHGVSGLTDLNTEVALSGHGDLTVTFNADLLKGSSDTVKLALLGTGSSTAQPTVDFANGGAVEGVKVSTTGTNLDELDGGNGLTNVQITGDGTNTFTFGASTAKTLTIDASTTTNSQNLILTTNAQTTNVTGGAGADTFTFADKFDEKDVVDGGDGDDKLIATISEKMAPKLTAVETLDLTFTSKGPLDGSNITGATTVNLFNEDSEAQFTKMDKSIATLNMVRGGDAAGNVQDVTFAYADGSEATLTINAGDLNSTNDNPSRGVSRFWDNVAVENAKTITVNSVYDEDNVKGTQNAFARFDAGNATSLTLATTAKDKDVKADLFTGQLTGSDLTSLTLNDADGTTLDMTGPAAFAATHLENLTVSVGKKGTVNYGDLNNASVLSKIAIDVADNGTLIGGDINGGDKALTSVNIKVGDGATVDDGNGGGLGTITANGSTLSSYNLEVGSLSAEMTFQALSVDSIKSGSITLADQSSNHELDVTLTTAATGSIKDLAVNAGDKGTVDLHLSGGANAKFGTVTLSGEGVVAVDSAAAFGTAEAGSHATFDASSFNGELRLNSAVGSTTDAGDTIQNSVTVGSGEATITLTAATSTDEIVYEKAAFGNAELEIANFDGGAVDLMNFTSFGVKSLLNGVATHNANGSALDGKIVFMGNDTNDSNILALFSGANADTIEVGSKAVFLCGNQEAVGALDLYVVDNASGEDVTSSEVQALGSVNVTTAVLTADDFVVA